MELPELVAERKIFKGLPLPLQYPEEPNLPIADWLTVFIDEYAYYITAKGYDFAINYTSGNGCPADALDWLASIIAGDLYWDSAWTVDQKRRILINLRWLRETRGSANTFRWMLENFSLDATFEPIGGWIVGALPVVASALPVDLSGSPYDYRITISEIYLDSTPQYALILELIKDWLPCWVNVEIVRL